MRKRGLINPSHLNLDFVVVAVVFLSDVNVVSVVGVFLVVVVVAVVFFLFT